MKNLNLIIDSKLNQNHPALNYIQYKDGYFNATNKHILLRIPASEIFQDDIIEILPDECYFDYTNWSDCKMSKMGYSSFKNGMIEISDSKANNLGYLKIISKENFINIGIYPDILAVIPEIGNAKDVVNIGFNPELLNKLYSVMNKARIKLTFFGGRKGILVEFNESKAIGLLMPIMID